MPETELLAREVEDFLASDARRWMTVGEAYYTCGDTEITRRQLGRYENGRLVPDDSAPNNRLSHSFVRNMVDDKVSYLLSRDHTFRCDDTEYAAAVSGALGRDFGYRLTRLGFEASNKGIAWLRVYIDEEGAFRTRVVPSEQCIPLWRDDEHTELDGLLHVYDLVEYDGRRRGTRTCVDRYTALDVRRYVLRDGTLQEAVDLPGNPVQPHFTRGGVGMGFGIVPFVPFKNNVSELPDVRFVKSLVDEYDKCRSDNANFLEELRRFYWVLKGYSGTDLAEFRRNLNWYGVIRVDDPAEGGVEAISPAVDLSGFTAHFEQLKRDILECGQAVNKNLDRIGAAPSGVALKFLYSALDLKCNHMEVEFGQSFRQLVRLADVYLGLTGGPVADVPIDLILNRDVTVNESETIANCAASLPLLSRWSILEQHPWVRDAAVEARRIEAERDAGHARGETDVPAIGAPAAAPAAEAAKENGNQEEGSE